MERIHRSYSKRQSGHHKRTDFAPESRKLTSHKKERKIRSLLEGKTNRWKVSSFINRFVTVVAWKNQCSSELYKLSQDLDISTLSVTKIEKGHTPFLHQIRFPRGPLSGGGLSKARKARHRIRTPTHRTSPTATHHDRFFVKGLETAQNSLEFHQTANGRVLCCGDPSEDHQPQRRIRKNRKTT